MKKFVGSVNGKSYDNKEDWTEAAKKAIKESDGNLAISSYYSYKDEESDEDEEDNFVGTNEYFIGDRKPDMVNDDGVVYNVSDELIEKIKNSINKDSIRKKLVYHSGLLDRDETLLSDKILSYQTEIESMKNKIAKMNEEIKKTENDRKVLLGKKKYYDTIVDEIDKTYIEDKVFNKEEKKPLEEKRSSFEDALKSFGSMTLYDIFKKHGLIV